MRVTSRILGTTLALALLLAALLAVVEAGLALIGSPPWLVTWPSADDLARLTWTAPSFRLAMVAIGALGVVLLAWAWWPRPAVTLPTVGQAETPMRVRRTSVETTVAARVREQAFVTDAEVSARRGTVVVHAGTTRPTSPEERELVEHTVQRALVELGLDPASATIHLRQGTRRAA